jgi:hypothetical protein
VASRAPVATVLPPERPAEACRLSILVADGRCAAAPLDARQALQLAADLLEHAARSVALANAVATLLKPVEAAPASARPKERGGRAVLGVLAAFLILLGAARAAPPPGADPDSPVGRWFQSLRVPGQPEASCCSIADCRVRPVRKLAADLWQVLEGETWLDVPPAAIGDRTDNPLGATVSCVYEGAVRCLFWGGAV